MRAPGALGLSVGDPSPSRCPARSRTSRFRRRRGRAGPTPCGTLQGTALGLRTPGHVKVRAPPGQTLSAWRPRPNAKRGWGSAAPAQGVPRTTPDRRGPRSSPAQRWEGVPAAPFFLRHPHSGPAPLPWSPGPERQLGDPPAPAPPEPAGARSRPTRGWQGIRPAATGVPRHRTPRAPQRRGGCGAGGGGRSRAPHRRPGRKPPGPPAVGRESVRSPDAGRGRGSETTRRGAGLSQAFRGARNGN